MRMNPKRNQKTKMIESKELLHLFVDILSCFLSQLFLSTLLHTFDGIKTPHRYDAL